MGLTVYPTILFNSSTGSDSAASGAGPATAITGTCAASTNSTTVTFNGTPDLTGVAQDGSHVLWVSGIGFVRISTVNTGAYTCVVETALTIGSGTDFAIGGKRATLDAAESRRLFAATSSPTASGMKAPCKVQIEDDQTITSAITCSMNFTGVGEFIVEGVGQRTITQTGNAAFFACQQSSAKYRFRNFTPVHTNATKSHFVTTGATNTVIFENIICGNSTGTNCPKGLTARTGNASYVEAHNCSVLRCSGTAIENVEGAFLRGVEIARCAAGVLQSGTSAIDIHDTIIAQNTGIGIQLTGTLGLGTHNEICGNTIDGNGGDGIKVTGNNLSSPLRIVNNQLTNNTGYGLNLSGTQPHTPIVQNNNFYANTTNPANGITLDATNLTADPGYTDRTNTVRNYAVGTAMKAAGFPASTATIGAGQSGTTSYVDIGAAQRQEASGGGYSRSGRGTIR